MKLTRLSQVMCIVPWAWLVYFNVVAGIVGLVVQLAGLILLLAIGFSGKWNEV